MDFLELSLRVAGSSAGAKYAPVVYSGLTGDEVALLAQTFAPHVPQAVDSTFNHWYVTRFTSGGIYCRRATWDQGWSCETIEEVAEKVAAYYARP